MIFILATTHQQAGHLARRLGLTPEQWAFLQDPYLLRGEASPLVVASDDWEQRADAFEMKAMLSARRAEVWYRR